MEPKVSEQQQEEIVRKSKAYENDDIGDLRKHSRRAYLDKRKEKLLEIEDEIRDHEYIFEGVKLTEAEQRELRYKKEIYELAKKHWEEDNEDEYVMSGVYDIDGGIHQEERFSVATQHYWDPYYTCQRQQRKCHVGKGSRHCELISLVVRKVCDFLWSLLHFFSDQERKEGEQQLLG
ncbi:pre-mRNA-splicing factor ATP-dependent RNA helicase DEAH1-like [Carex rostrata]